MCKYKGQGLSFLVMRSIAIFMPRSPPFCRFALLSRHAFNLTRVGILRKVMLLAEWPPAAVQKCCRPSALQLTLLRPYRRSGRCNWALASA